MIFLCGLFTGLFVGVVFGFVLATLLRPAVVTAALQSKQPIKKKQPRLTEDEKREVELKRRELENFMAYTGDPLPDPKDLV